MKIIDRFSIFSRTKFLDLVNQGALRVATFQFIFFFARYCIKLEKKAMHEENAKKMKASGRKI